MNRSRLLLPLWLVIAATASAACTVVVDSDRSQCKTDSDCATLGLPGGACVDSICRPDPTWSCLDESTTDEVPPPIIHVMLTVADLLSQKPVPGVRLTLCAKLDADCLLPIAIYQSNEAGQLDVEMPGGFDGYFQTEAEGIYPTLFFPPNTRKQRAPATLPMVPTSFFGVMFNQLGVSVSGDRTVIMTTAVDCLGRPAPGVILSTAQADAHTVGYFLEGGLPSRTAATTDQEGAGGFVNIRTGSATITSTIAATNRLAGSVTVQTRPGHLTMVAVVPNGG